MNAIRLLTLITLASLPLVGAAQDTKPREPAGCATGPDPELADIIQGFAKRTGRKFIVDPRLRATPGFAGIDPAKITYEQLLATLALNQFVLVEQGDLTVVTVDAVARQLPTPVHDDPGFKALDDEWVTMVLGLKGTCAAHLVPILRPLMPQAAHLAAEPQTNSLIIDDRAVNVRRIVKIAQELDSRGSPGKLPCDWARKGE